MGFFDSSSEQNANPVSAQQSQQTADSSLALALNTTASSHSDATTVLNVTQTDYGALNKAIGVTDTALQFAGEAGAAAYQQIGAAQNNAYEFSAGVVQNASNAVTQQLSGLYDTVDKSLQASENARNDALTFAAGAIQAGKQSQSDAINLVDNALTETLASNQKSQELTAQSANNALEFGAGAIQTALQTVTTENSTTLGLVDKLFSQTVEQLAGQTTKTLDSLAAAQTKTINTIGEQTKSESAQSLDKLIQVVGYALAGIAVLFLVTAKGRMA